MSIQYRSETCLIHCIEQQGFKLFEIVSVNLLNMFWISLNDLFFNTLLIFHIHVQS